MNAILAKEVEPMKFIINGRTFDTSSATTVAISRGEYEDGMSADAKWEPPTVRYENVLYRTANGAFFVHYHDTRKHQRGKPVVTDKAVEVTPEGAVEWIVKYEAVIVDPTDLNLPEEA